MAQNVIEEESENTDQSDFNPLNMIETGIEVSYPQHHIRSNSVTSLVNSLSHRTRQDYSENQTNSEMVQDGTSSDQSEDLEKALNPTVFKPEHEKEQ